MKALTWVAVIVSTFCCTVSSRVVTALALAWLFLFGITAAAPPPDPFSPSDELKWVGLLRQVGATTDEITLFDQMLHEQSPAVAEDWAKMLRSASTDFFSTYLVDVRRSAELEAKELVPRPLFGDVVPVCSLDRLRRISIPNMTVDSVTIDPTDGSCRVEASVTNPPAEDRVKVFLGLPMKGWNGRFLGTGGGGFMGGSRESLRNPVRKGFAVAATNAGHDGDAYSGAFALDANGKLDEQEVRDFGYLGIHEMTVVGKAIATAFYGMQPMYSYFIAGSAGGRQALEEAQRYPEDYERIHLFESPFESVWIC
jgi:Tannase and feruloyl esterase